VSRAFDSDENIYPNERALLQNQLNLQSCPSKAKGESFSVKKKP